jgi:phage tail sheath protein FI
MASAFVSPGLYIRENDQSLFVPSLADTPFGVVITASWGPINEPTLITSQAQLFDTFGPLSGATNYNPALVNYPDQPGLYALDRYMRRGRRCVVVRVGKLTGTNKLTKAIGTVPGMPTNLVPPTLNNTIPYIADPTTAPTLTGVVSGGTLAAGKYTAIYTFYNGNGESKASIPSAVITTTGAVSSLTIAAGIAVPVGAVGIKVYIGFHATLDPTGTEKFSTSQAAVGTTTLITITTAPTDRSSDVYTVTARYPGTMGNQIKLRASRGSNYTLAAPTQKVTLYLESPISTKLVQTETFDGINADANDTVNGIAARITARTSKYVDLALISAPSAVASGSIAPTAQLTTPVVGVAGKLAPGTYLLTYTYVRIDATGTAIESMGAPASSGVVIPAGPSNGSFTISTESIPAGAGVLAVVAVNLYITPANGAIATARRVQTVRLPVSGSALIFTVVNTADKQLMAESATTAPTVSLSGGIDGTPSIAAGDPLSLVTSTYIGTAGTTNDPATGLQIFRNTEGVQVNLLAVPGIHFDSVVNEIIDVCAVARGDCLGLVDPPPDLSPDEIIKWHNGKLGDTGSPTITLNSSYAALWWPYLQTEDAFNAQRLWLSPSGFAAEVIAFTDFTADPWFAPAGLTRGRITNVLRAQYLPNQGDRDALYSGGNAVNPITTFAQNGIVIWGQRTLQREPTALDRINVRRLLIITRKAIQTAANSLVFQPNDATMRRKFINLVTPILQGIKQRRGLVDFRVRMDESNNPPSVIEQNMAVADIFLKPTKAAEIIIVNFIVTSQESNFDETVTTGTI